MIDHVTGHPQDEKKRDEETPARGVNESENDPPGSYYYDDSSNYEIYSDDDSEVDDSQVSD